jgi:GT2 family glycosyltransferase
MAQHCGRPAPLRDRALQLASERYLLLTDNGVDLAQDAVANLMAVMSRRPDAAACMGIVIAAEDRNVIRNQAHPLHYLCWSTADLPRKLEELKDSCERPGIGTGIQLLDVAKAREVGGFDQLAVFGWGDDAGIHHRLRLAGYQTFSVPNAIIYHRQQRRTSRRIYGQVHNRLLIMLMTYQTRTLVLAGPALVLFELVLVAFLFAKGHGRDYLQAVRDLAYKRRPIWEQRSRTQTLRRVPDRDLLGAGPLDLPGAHDGSLVGRAFIGALSRVFRWYWSAVRRLL